jgi:hypothetical protein
MINFFTNVSRLAIMLNQPPIQWVLNTLSPELKWSVCEADLSPPSNAKVKNAWSYISNPSYIFMV